MSEDQQSQVSTDPKAEAITESCQTSQSLHDSVIVELSEMKFQSIRVESCQDIRVLHDQVEATSPGRQENLTPEFSCQKSENLHDSLMTAPLDRAVIQLTEAIGGLVQAVNDLTVEGTRNGSIAAYTKPNGRTYYNYVTCEQGKVRRVYLPLRQKPGVEVEIERGRRAAKLRDLSELLEQALERLKDL